MKNNSFKEDELYSNPTNIQFLNNIVEDVFAKTCLDNIFCLFKSINDILYLVYSNSQKSIISYNLINNQRINEIKNAHKEFIVNFRHYLDKIYNIDLIMSISSKDNNIKLWKISNWECLLNLTNINNYGLLEAKNYIITSNCFIGGLSEPIKIFDFQGNKLNETKDSNKNTKYIDTYFMILI